MLLGFTNPDDQAHAPNEQMVLANYEGGVRTIARYWEALRRPAALRAVPVGGRALRRSGWYRWGVARRRFGRLPARRPLAGSVADQRITTSVLTQLRDAVNLSRNRAASPQGGPANEPRRAAPIRARARPGYRDRRPGTGAVAHGRPSRAWTPGDGAAAGCPGPGPEGPGRRPGSGSPPPRASVGPGPTAVRPRSRWLDRARRSPDGMPRALVRAIRAERRPRRATCPCPGSPRAAPRTSTGRSDRAPACDRAPAARPQVLSTLAGKVAQGDVDQYQPVPLGFTPLDKTIGGGLRAGELLLIGGAQGTGKTTMAVQMARNIVHGRPGERALRLLRARRGVPAQPHHRHGVGAPAPARPRPRASSSWTCARRSWARGWRRAARVADLMANPRLRPALERINRYGPNLFLLRGSQTTNTVENLNQLDPALQGALGRPPPGRVHRLHAEGARCIPDPPTETEKVTYVVNGLKDVALHNDVPMISIVAADKEGLKASRLRNHHLRGSSAINYEADIILILNEKYQIVAKVNIEFNPYQAQRFRDWVIVHGREEPRRPERGRPRVREALRVLLLRPQRPDRPGEAHRGAPLQRLTRAVRRASAPRPCAVADGRR